MRGSFSAGLRSAAEMAGVAGLVAACGSTPIAAPVIERSQNAGPRPVIAAQSATAVQSSPPIAPAVSAVEPAKSQPSMAGSDSKAAPAMEQARPASDEPTTKPYREGDWRPEYHVVKKGDTLYSIALDYGQDYRELAAWNNLDDPGMIKIDQRLRLFPQGSTPEAGNVQPTPLAAPLATPVFSEPKARKLPYSEQAFAELKIAPTKTDVAATSPASAGAAQSAAKPPVPNVMPPLTVAAPKANAAVDSKMTWEWPAQGRLLYGFGQGPNQKGLGIEGRSGQPVLAAAPGKVVYSGNGLRGYGKLVIVKHNATYLSVYAHNSQILVKEGQTVAKGQKIGEIGDTDADRTALHFEIRRLGKPIDPLPYLPERAS